LRGRHSAICTILGPCTTSGEWSSETPATFGSHQRGRDSQVAEIEFLVGRLDGWLISDAVAGSGSELQPSSPVPFLGVQITTVGTGVKIFIARLNHVRLDEGLRSPSASAVCRKAACSMPACCRARPYAPSLPARIRDSLGRRVLRLLLLCIQVDVPKGVFPHDRAFHRSAESRGCEREEANRYAMAAMETKKRSRPLRNFGASEKSDMVREELICRWVPSFATAACFCPVAGDS